jgi:hypothetical protein
MKPGLRARMHNVGGRADLALTLRQRGTREAVETALRTEETRERRRREDLMVVQPARRPRIAAAPVAPPAPAHDRLAVAAPVAHSAEPVEPPPAPPPAPPPRRVALCIGVNYTGQEAALRGCVNDVSALAEVLQQRFGFAVTALTDDTPTRPTRAAIIEAVRALVAESNAPGVESVFMSYSGHGAQLPDAGGDEPDGQDEVLVPIDYLSAGYITDDELHALLRGLGCPAVLLFDSCHSGSILDLRYRYEAAGVPAGEGAADLKQRVVCLSGCSDAGESADAYVERSRRFQGAMTTAFLHVLARRSYEATCFELLAGVQARIRAMGHQQVPQLSSSAPIDPAQRFCGGGTLP